MPIRRFGQEIQDVLHRIHQLPHHREQDKTFLEIAGYPHLENVASNIFEFYFQSTSNHNYHNTLFRAIMSFFNTDISLDVLVNARREDVTTENKRIDIVIETDTVVLGIENKIYHQLNNDLKIYWSHLQGIANGRKVHGVVLSLHRVELPRNETNFINITYSEFLNQVDMLFRNNQNTQGNKYNLFFEDFYQTMRNLSRGTAMDYERLEFFRYHHQEIQSLLSEVKQIRGEMRGKLKMLSDALRIQDSFYGLPLKQGTWSSDTQVKEFLSYAFDLQNRTSIQIDIFLDIGGWGMQFFNQRGERGKVQEWIDQRSIPYTVQMRPLWRLILVMDERIPYEADIGYVYDWSMNLLRRILP
jgi:hypothetical protein